MKMPPDIERCENAKALVPPENQSRHARKFSQHLTGPLDTELVLKPSLPAMRKVPDIDFESAPTTVHIQRVHRKRVAAPLDREVGRLRNSAL